MHRQWCVWAIFVALGSGSGTEQEQQWDVVIIGAGAAGLNAASVLCRRQRSVLVLEARNRTGGRIWSLEQPSSFENPVQAGADVVLDLGAGWIHGEKNDEINDWISRNPTLILAERSNATLKPVPLHPFTETFVNLGPEWWDSSVAMFHDRCNASNVSSACRVDGDTLAINWGRFSLTILAAMEVASKKNPESSLEDLVRPMLEKHKVLLQPGDLAVIEWLISAFEDDIGTRMSEVHSRDWHLQESYFGNDHVAPDGMSQILSPLIQDIQSHAPKCEIRFNQIVNSHSKSKAISCGKGCTDFHNVIGTRAGSIIRAGWTIFTPSIGVLQNKSITFDPPLGPSLQSAIDSIGMGVTNKIFLRFSSVFWPSSAPLLASTFSSTNATKLFSRFWSLLNQTGQPILCTAVVGEEASMVESWDDAAIGAAAVKVLQLMFPTTQDSLHPSIELRDVVVTRWQSDPFAKGAYSFPRAGFAIGHDSEARRNLTYEDNGLIFAGEATSISHAGTMQGALISGERAAKQLLASDLPSEIEKEYDWSTYLSINTTLVEAADDAVDENQWDRINLHISNLDNEEDCVELATDLSEIFSNYSDVIGDVSFKSLQGDASSECFRVAVDLMADLKGIYSKSYGSTERRAATRLHFMNTQLTDAHVLAFWEQPQKQCAAGRGFQTTLLQPCPITASHSLCNFSGNALTGQGAERVLDSAISCGTHDVVVDLSHNAIGDIAALKLVHKLQEHSADKEKQSVGCLLLHGNKLTEQGIAALDSAANSTGWCVITTLDNEHLLKTGIGVNTHLEESCGCIWPDPGNEPAQKDNNDEIADLQEHDDKIVGIVEHVEGILNNKSAGIPSPTEEEETTGVMDKFARLLRFAKLVKFKDQEETEITNSEWKRRMREETTGVVDKFARLVMMHASKKFARFLMILGDGDPSSDESALESSSNEGDEDDDDDDNESIVDSRHNMMDNDSNRN